MVWDRQRELAIRRKRETQRDRNGENGTHHTHPTIRERERVSKVTNTIPRSKRERKRESACVCD